MKSFPNWNLITDLIPIESDRASSLSLVEKTVFVFLKIHKLKLRLLSSGYYLNVAVGKRYADFVDILCGKVDFSVGSPFSLYS